jgi:hypothetical protein
MKKSREITILLNEKPVQKPKLHWYEELVKIQQKPKVEVKKNMTIDITITLPKAQKPKRKVTVFSNFVKVGFDQYNIKIDPFTGYEYVKIDGKRYEIARDIFNRGVLVEI